MLLTLRCVVACLPDARCRHFAVSRYAAAIRHCVADIALRHLIYIHSYYALLMPLLGGYAAPCCYFITYYAARFSLPLLRYASAMPLASSAPRHVCCKAASMRTFRCHDSIAGAPDIILLRCYASHAIRDILMSLICHFLFTYQTRYGHYGAMSPYAISCWLLRDVAADFATCHTCCRFAADFA